MTSENQMKSRLENMPAKQKIMMVVTAIVLLIVIWQVVGLFKGPSTPAAAFTPASPAGNMNANAPGAGGMAPGPGGGMASPPPGGGMASAPGGGMAPPGAAGGVPAAQNAPAGAVMYPQGPATQPPSMAVPKETPIAKDQNQEEQDKIEKRYLKQLNDLEQLKLERQIEETNQAIAAAKLATVTAEKNTADLLTKPSITVPESAYANQLVSPTRSGTSISEGLPVQGPPTQQVPPPEQIIPEVSYTVISVSMQFNKWTAVMGAQGKLYNVSVGDTLPPDGSIVSSINKNGVTLRNENKTRRISMTTGI
jgi:hypothetical protein